MYFSNDGKYKMIFEFFYYSFIAMVILLAWIVFDDFRMEKRNEVK